MRIREAIKLGHINITAHKRRSLTVMIVVGALFSVMMAGVMIVQGLENLLTQSADALTGGKTLLLVRSGTWSEEKIAESVKVHHGMMGEQVQTVKQGYPVIAPDLARNLIAVNLEEVPEGTLPVLVPFSVASYWQKISMPQYGDNEKLLRIARQIREGAIGKTFEHEGSVLGDFVVGVLPESGSLALERSRNIGINPLDMVLSLVSGASGMIMVIDTGVEKVDAGVSWWIAEFERPEDAYEFAKPSYECEMRSVENCEYSAVSLFGNQVEIVRAFKIVNLVMSGIVIVLAIIAMVIIVFTALRLVSQDQQTIALYRALGATMRDVWIIYLVYLVELCLLAAGLAVFVGAILATVTSVVNASNLQRMLELAYNVITDGMPLLLGVNWGICGIIVAMMGIGVLCSLIVLPQFSARNLSKKLKN